MLYVIRILKLETQQFLTNRVEPFGCSMKTQYNSYTLLAICPNGSTTSRLSTVVNTTCCESTVCCCNPLEQFKTIGGMLYALVVFAFSSLGKIRL